MFFDFPGKAGGVHQRRRRNFLAQVFANFRQLPPLGGQPDRDRHRGPRLDERHFRRVDKFGGGTGWKEFSFQIRTAAGAAHSKVREGMDEIVKAGKDPTYDVIFDDWSDEDVLRVGSELYAVLS